MSTSSDQQAAGAPSTTPHTTQEILLPEVVAAAPARPTAGHDLPPPRAAQRPAGVPAEPSGATASSVAPPGAPPVPAAQAQQTGEAQQTGPVDVVPGPPAAEPGRPVAGSTPGPVPPPVPPPVTAPGATPEGAAGTPAAWPETLQPDDRPRARKLPRAVRPADRQALAGLALAVVALALLQVGLLGGFGAGSFWSTVTLWSAFASLCGVLALAAFAAFYPAGNRLRSAAIWRIAAAGLVGLSVFWVLVVLPVVASDRGFVLTAALACLGAALWIGPRRRG